MRDLHRYDFRKLPDANRHVFQIGLPRTGSRSLTVAMWQLGYLATHGPNTPQEDECWRRSIAYGQFATSDICRKYEFVGHAAPYYHELDLAWPDAKFILLRREMPGWLKSLRRQLRARGSAGRGRQAKATRGNVDALTMLRIACFGTCGYDRRTFPRKLEIYTDTVRRYFCNKYKDAVSAKLLEMWLIEHPKWDVLCKFLDVRMPSVPFPKSRTRVAINNCYREMYDRHGIVEDKTVRPYGVAG